MRRKAVYILIGVAAMSMMGVCLWLAKRGSAYDPGWGQGPLKVAEREYYVGRIVRITEAWQDMARQMKRDRQGRIDNPSFACLAIDTAENRMWLESNGKPLAGHETDLPSRMDWRLFHDTPDGVTGLGSLVRLRIAGLYTDRQRQETVRLVSTQDGPETLYFTFSPSGSCGHGYSSGAMNWQSKWDSSAGQIHEDAYPSVVVTDADYEQAKAQFDPDRAVLAEDATLRENRLTWVRVEKALPQEIDRQLMRHGLELSSLKLTCGPDYTAASATLHAGRSGLLSAFRGGPPSAHVYLQIDSLGNDVWYARSAPHPLRPMPQRLLLDMEFLISATGQVPKKDRPTLLAEGRRRQREIRPQSPSEWRVNLPNGVTIEFIGLCENPSGGRQWWGPDGSPLGFAPYVNYEPYGMQREDRTTYEIAWRIHAPEQGQSSIHSSFEGTVGSYGRQVHDRYGNRIFGGLQDTGCAFDRSRETTTLKVGVSVDDGPFAWATLKNISLVPGKNQGFEIIPGEE